MSDDDIVSLNARISRGLKNKIKILAIQENKTMQDLFEELVTIGFEHYKKE